MKKVITVFTLWLAMLTVAFAQTDTIVSNEDDVMSLEDLMKVKVTVASRNEQTLRETPGVVTIITSEEIKNSGARDLIDVLRLVPGFDFAQDIEGVIGIGVRGNWAQEAKMLFKIDGVDVVETAYGSLQFGAHYPVNNIDRIEIIRGPGSTIYGGNASLAVINIITRDGKKINGVGANVAYGQMQNIYGRRTISIGGGREFKNGVNLSANLYTGQANMSDRNISGPNGDINYADSSKIRPLLLNVGLKYKGLDARYIFDNYKYQVTGGNNTYLFSSHLGAISYNFKVNDKLSIIPRFSFKNQLPWFYLNKKDVEAYETNVRTARYTGAVQVDYKPLESLEIIGGSEYFYDMATVAHPSSSSFMFNGDKKQVTYNNIAAFLQAQYFSKWVNLTAGVRYDKHNRFGGVVVPRVVLTKIFGKFHAKLMYSKAFRAPMIFNMDVNPNIKPEHVTVYEAEVGMMINDKMFVTLNLYDNSISSPIVYTYINDIENYSNGNHLGSRGIEFEYRLKDSWGNITANYSFYHSHKSNEMLYSPNGVNGMALAFPAHKATLSSSIKIYKGISINPVAVIYSSRYGYNTNDDLVKYKPVGLLSTYINYDNIVKGLSAGIGVFDILGQNYQFVQAYRSNYNPQPGPSREVVVRLRYKFSFSN